MHQQRAHRVEYIVSLVNGNDHPVHCCTHDDHHRGYHHDG